MRGKTQTGQADGRDGLATGGVKPMQEMFCNNTHKDGTDKKEVASRANRTGLEPGGCQAAEIADEFGREVGWWSCCLLMAAWIFAIVRCRDGVARSYRARGGQEERELSTTRVPRNNIGPGGGWNRRKTQENNKEKRERMDKRQKRR